MASVNLVTLIDTLPASDLKQMAFSSGYEHDVFVSYSTVDDQQKWVTRLVRQLKIRLAAWLGRSDSFDVWWDRKDLDVAQKLETEIGGTLSETATLVVVLSQAYVASSWCKDELKFFLDAVGNREMPDRRIYVVDLGNLNLDDRPEELHDFVGFNFWETDEIDTRRTLGFPTPDLEKDREFCLVVDDLARKISDRLKELRKTPEPTTVNVRNLNSNETSDAPLSKNGEKTLTVFLAEATDDLEEHRNEVVQYLDQANFRVVPSEAYPTDFEKCQAAISADLATTEGSVFAQLLGPLPGRKLTGVKETRRLMSLQCEAAEAAGMKIVQWRDLT